MSLDVFLTITVDTGGTEPYQVSLYSANITHNLAKMATKAGIYKHLWRPEEINIEIAGQLIEPLKKGLSLMKAKPERFKAFDDSDGWGTYEQFVPWIEDYLRACEEHPKAKISIWR